MKSKVWSVERTEHTDVYSVECGVASVKSGVKSVECAVRSVEC